MGNLRSDDIQGDIAIIGMSWRFPKAKNLDHFWLNLREGRECISFFSEEDLHASGINPAFINNFEIPTIAGLTELIETFRLTGPGPRLYRETTTSDWEEGKI